MFCQNFLEKYFTKSTSVKPDFYLELFAFLAPKLALAQDSKSVYDQIASVLSDSLQTRSLIFLDYDEKIDQYEIKYRKGIEAQNPKSFIGNENIKNLFFKKGGVVVFDEVDLNEREKNAKTIKLIKGWGTVAVVPLKTKRKNFGLLLLSRKESGDVYDNKDLEMLSTVGALAAMTLENVEFSEMILGFSQRLTRELEKETKSLRVSNAELKKLDEAKSEFIHVASHQLRGPLGAIYNYASLLHQGDFGSLSPKIAEPIQRIFENSERLSRLTENLLDISRLEIGQVVFRLKPIQLETIVENVCEEFEPVAKKRGLKIVFDLPVEKLASVSADESRIRQVIRSLIENSIKYSSEKGWVKVNIRQEGERIIFVVSDNGLGIGAEDLSRLFLKFSRGMNVKKSHLDGSGLGLFVAKQIVEAHGGRIWAESEGLEKGSRFCFELNTVK